MDRTSTTDLSANTNWLLLDVVEVVWVGIDDLALDLVGPAGVVVEATRGHADIDLGHGDSLAVVKSLDGSEKVEVLLEEIGETVEKLSAVLWRLTSPWALECLTGSGNGDVYILLGCLVDGCDDLLSRWVDRLKGTSINTGNELVVDETAACQCGPMLALSELLTVQWAGCICRRVASQAERTG